MKTLVVKAVQGNIVSKHLEDKPYTQVVKDVVAAAVNEWNPEKSDLTVIRAKLEVEYKHPISPELYDKILELNLNAYRQGDLVVVEVPLFVISYDNEWLGDTYHDKAIYVVAPYLDDNMINAVASYATDTTKGPKKLGESAQLTLSEEAMKRLEEGLKEVQQIEEEEERKTRRRRKRRSTSG